MASTAGLSALLCERKTSYAYLDMTLTPIAPLDAIRSSRIAPQASCTTNTKPLHSLLSGATATTLRAVFETAGYFECADFTRHSPC